MDPLTARKTWRTLEPIHGAIYFAAEAREEFAAIGLDDRMTGYFASRSAPMGPVSADVVIATFFNFDPDLVRRSMDGVWDRVSPAEVLAARLRGADRMIRRHAAEFVGTDTVADAAVLARTAALAAVERPEGRPLFAGHASLPWPDEPHLVLWHAQSLLREYRGDGHVAALTVEGLDGCEALVTHAAAGDVSADILRATRQRTGDDWLAAEERLRERGWLDPDLALTEFGRERRDWIEARTDELAAAPYDAVGVDGCERLRTLCRPVSQAMMAAFS
jgi:Helix-turn-helix family